MVWFQLKCKNEKEKKKEDTGNFMESLAKKSKLILQY